jgi:hypothetical protein
MITKLIYGRIKTGFYAYTGIGIVGYTQSILIALTDNANFPLTQALLVPLGDVLKSFSDALANAQTRDKVAVGLKNTARTELEIQLLTVANSVSNEALGNRDKLLSCGFELYKNSNTPAPALGPVKDFTVTDGINPGQLKLQAKGPAGAKSYVHQYTPDPITPSSVWISYTSTLKEYTFSNLESGKKYWGRMIAIGVKDQVSISNPASRIVQ